MRFHFDRFEFRDAKLSEWEELTALEKVCFPPNEACTSEQLRQRIEKASENFFVACDQVNPKLAGFLCGICSDEPRFRDEFFMDAALHEPAGKTVYLLGLNVSPEYRHHGLATALMDRYIEREKARGREALVLTCHTHLVTFYEGFGFEDLGIGDSRWGGESWHDMRLSLR